MDSMDCARLKRFYLAHKTTLDTHLALIVTLLTHIALLDQIDMQAPKAAAGPSPSHFLRSESESDDTDDDGDGNIQYGGW